MISRGTLSLLVGAHQIVLHPILVTVAWWKLYRQLPSWWEAIAIVVHDWGYLGCESMDGEDGELHPDRGASLAFFLVFEIAWFLGMTLGMKPYNASLKPGDLAREAERLVAGHSRYYSRKVGCPLSKLYAADKLSITLHPAWLYLPGAWLSGELREYRIMSSNHFDAGRDGIPYSYGSMMWFRWIQRYMAKVAMEPNDECLDAGHNGDSDA